MAEKLLNKSGLEEFSKKIKEKSVFIKDEKTSTPAILDLIYPVGSIYMSVNSTSPETFIGGTWKRIYNRVLLGGGDDGDTTSGAKFVVGEAGGEYEHTLTEEEIPSHHHAIRVADTYNGNAGDARAAFATNADWWRGENHYDSNNRTNDVGGGQPHNNMQPYLAVYMWERVS